MFVGDANVSSSFMAPKEKGEGEWRVTFQDTFGADEVKSSCRLFSCFWWTKSASVGRIDPSGSKHPQETKRAQKWSKFKMVRMLLNQDNIVVLVVSIPMERTTLKSEYIWESYCSLKFVPNNKKTSQSQHSATWEVIWMTCGRPIGTHKANVAAQSTKQVDPQKGDAATPQVDTWQVGGRCVIWCGPDRKSVV